MLSQVFYCERISWVDLERSLKVLDCLLTSLKIVYIWSNLYDTHWDEGHRIIWIEFESFVHAKFCFRQVSKPVVAQTDAKPDIRWWARIFIDHLLQNGQTLLNSPFIELDYCLCQHVEGFNVAIRSRLLFWVLYSASLTSELRLALLTILLSLLELTSCDLIETHTDEVVWVDLRNRVCLFD